MNTLLSCIYFYSFLNQVDVRITQSVIEIESNGNPYALSPDRQDGGLMQIRMKYAPESRLQLFQSCTNVKRGTEILKRAKESCRECVDGSWVVAYNVGITGFKKIKHPKKFPYFIKITKAMK